MVIRNTAFATFLFFHMNQSFAFEQPQSIWDWVRSFFITTTQPTTPQRKFEFQKAVTAATAASRPFGLQEFYLKKEQEPLSTIMDPQESAKKFRQTIKNAAAKSGIMARFKDAPEKFLFGASSSSYQYEGGLDGNNANAIFYESKNLPPAGIAIDFWNRYKTDISQMKNELGINSFRLSIAWERVQPDKEVWDLSMIQQYADIIKTLKENGIEPIVVLHHYTVPTWFAKLGAFEKNQNNIYFVEFAKRMYTALHQDVTYWSTFNAIEGYAFKGYWTLDGPPQKHNMQLAQIVMANMLDSHVKIYQAIKGEKGLYFEYQNQSIPNPQIGIQKNIALLDPSEKSNMCVRSVTGNVFCVMGTLLQNKGFFDFFRTGTFKVSIPQWVNVTLTNNFAKKSIDWIGLNIYTNMFMRFLSKLPEDRPEFMTENLNYRDYPEGIYRAVKIVNDNIAEPLNIPIIITENGIATKNDSAGNEKRTRFFRRALYTIRKLIEEGYNIIGYTPWASHDNYEWPSQEQPNPYNRPYGLFYVDFNNPSLPRTLKQGAHYYRDFIKTYFGVQK